MSSGLVTWSSQRQRIVCLSTTKAEYVAAAHATKEDVWLKNLLQDIGEKMENAIDLYVDNQSAVRLIRNPEYHKRTKHIDVKYHFLRERYEDSTINASYVQGPSNYRTY